jgi:regulator of sigma E protease
MARGNEKRSFSVMPREIPQAQYVGIGIAFEHVGTISYPVHKAFIEAIRLSFTLCGQILQLIGSAIKHATISSFMGPVGVAVSTGAVAKLGFSYLMSLVVQLSLGLAIFNILPFPALDGGRALFVVIEKIRKKPVTSDIENMIHAIGFFLLIGLVLLVTIQDVQRLFSW